MRRIRPGARRVFPALPIFLVLAVALGELAAPDPVGAGPITGRYWFLGIGNDEASTQNEFVFDNMAGFAPWRDIPGARVKREGQAEQATDRVRLFDTIGGTEILRQVRFFHGQVRDGDTFVFYYGGHASSDSNDVNGDDPGQDEGLGLFPGQGHTLDVVTDDQMAADDLFASFPTSSTIIVIINACFGGGFIGGSTDLDRAAVRAKNNLIFMAPVGETCELTFPEADRFRNRLITALGQGDANRDGQVHAREWLNETRRLWEVGGRRLVAFDGLDAAHDRTVANLPAPSAVVQLGSALAAMAALGLLRRRLRRR